MQLLEQHNMKDVLEQERVYTQANDTEESAQEHYELIKSCTDKHKTEWTSYNISKNTS